jgi:hypothetical protein
MLVVIFYYCDNIYRMPPKRAARGGPPGARGGPPGARGGDDDDDVHEPKYIVSQGAKSDPKGSRSRSNSRPPEVPEYVLDVIRVRQTITVNGIQLWKEMANPEPLFHYLTSSDISKMSQSAAYDTRLAAYETVYPLIHKELNHRVWFNINYLINAMQSFMMPSHPEPGEQKVFVVNFGGAGTGKSNGLYAAGLDCMNTFILDPDRFYEFFATFLGYLPINDPTKQKERNFQDEWTVLKASFSDYENVIPPEEIIVDRRRPISTNCKVKAGCMTNYREMLTAVMYEVFKMALGLPSYNDDDNDADFSKMLSSGDLPGLNIVFDSTGSMLDVIEQYIQLAKRLRYEIRFVGVYSTLKNCLDRVLPPTDAAVRESAGDAKENEANDWQPERRIVRIDVEDSTHKGSAGSADMLVKCRNTEQHRKTEYGGLKSTWEGMIRSRVPAARLIQYALQNAYRLILVENNSKPPRGLGAAGIIYDSGDSRSPRFIESEKKPPRCALYRSDGFYGVTIHILLDMEKESKAGARAGFGGASRKRRLHTNRPRKTMKKYVRRVTRRRGGRGGHHSRRYRRH